MCHLLKNTNIVQKVFKNYNIYQEFESISVKLTVESGVKTTYKNMLFEYSGFIYYKISNAVSWRC